MKHLLITFVLLAGCGQGVNDHRGASPSLLAVYEKIEAEVGIAFTCFATYAEQVSPTDNAGYKWGASKVILIRDDVKMWDSFCKEELLLHEIAHCEFGLGEEADGIMNPQYRCDTEEIYKKDKAELIERIKKIIEAREKTD